MENSRKIVDYADKYITGDVDGIIIYLHVKDTIDIIDIRLVKDNNLLPAYCPERDSFTKEEFKAEKIALKEYLFSEKQYAQVLLLEIRRK